MFRLTSLLLAGPALIGLATGALAQSANPPPAADAATAGAPLYDPQQLPAEEGQVQQFTLTPRGDIDGLILSDGTEVKTPPHLSTDMAYSIRQGDRVTSHGLHAAALPLVQAVSITDEPTGRTVVDNGPPKNGGPPEHGPRRPPPPDRAAGPPPPPAPMTATTETTGRVRMALHGPRGEVNGALLDDGTILHFPPPEAARYAALLQPGRRVVAEGASLRNSIGTVVDVRDLSAARD
jgi:hypothetical protein